MTSPTLDVAGYNLTLVPQPREGHVPNQLDLQGLLPILHEPIIVESESRLLSLRDQVSIVFQPPRVVVIDHSTEQPVRDRFVQTGIQVVEMLRSLGLDIPVYGWNMSGAISDVDPFPAIRRLLNEPHLEERIAAGRESEWLATQVRFVIPSTLSDRTTIVLESAEGGDGEELLMFSANAHLQREPDIGQLEGEGDRIWQDVADLVRNLVVRPE